MAYGGLQGQAPQGVAPINGLPTNDVRELTVRSGNNISAGDVVDVEGGEVFKNVNPQSKPEVTVQNGYNHFISRVAKINGYYVFATSMTNNVGYDIYSYDQNGLLKSNISNRNVGAQSSTIQIGYCDNKVVVWIYESYQNAWFGYSYKISETGTIIQENSNKFNYEIQGALPLSNTQCIGFYTNGAMYAQIIDLSGNSPSYIKSVELTNTNRNFAKIISSTQISDKNGKKRFCVCYIDTQDSNKAKAFILTIDSGNNIETTPPVIVENSAITIKCAFLDNIIYVLTGGKTYAYDEELTYLNNITLFSTVGEYTSNLFALKDYIIEFGPAGGSNFKVIALKYESQTFKKGSEHLVEKNYGNEYFNGMCIFGNKAFVVCKEIGSKNANNKAIITLFEVNNYEIANEFIDNSKDAIALQSGTFGQSISVGFGGYCPCDGIVEGQMITSSGVMGYGIQDSWLDIRPEYGKSIVTGDYIGDGSKNRKIDIGFTPKNVSVYNIGEISSINGTVFPLSTNEKGFLYQGSILLQCTDNGFIISHVDTLYTKNQNNISYGYIAFR